MMMSRMMKKELENISKWKISDIFAPETILHFNNLKFIFPFLLFEINKLDIWLFPW